MGNVKNLTAEFELLQRTLLKHKYLYYVKSAPIISDYDYDLMENESRKMAQKLGFRADQWEGPAQDEVEHVHWMVDFDPEHPLAKSVIEEIEKSQTVV